MKTLSVDAMVGGAALGIGSGNAYAYVGVAAVSRLSATPPRDLRQAQSRWPGGATAIPRPEPRHRPTQRVSVQNTAARTPQGAAG